jgi:phage-related protein
VALGAALSDSIELAKIQEDAEKQLAAVIKSTGGAAGLSADEIKKMASSLQAVTNFGDEAIIGGQNLLLTFTNIGKDTFPRATEAILDMSTAFGQDLKSSAIQLGKALNDPINGVTALSRVGVSFTEQQKEQIKAMQEAGDVAGAQAVILAELERQVGGSARAMVDPVDQLNNVWGDLKEVLGAAILPLIESLATRVMPIVSDAIGKVTGFVEKLRIELGAADTPLAAIIDSLDVFLPDDIIARIWDFVDGITAFKDQLMAFKDRVMEALQPVFEFIAANFQLSDVLIALGAVIASIIVPALIGIIAAAAPVIAVALALIAGVALLRKAWEADFGGIREFTDKAMAAIKAIIDRVLQLIAKLWKDNGDGTKSYLQTLWGSIETLFGGFLDGILWALDTVLKLLEGDWEGAWQNVLDIATGLWQSLQDAWGEVLGQITKAIADIDWGKLGMDMINGIIGGIQAAAGGIGAAIGNAIGGVGSAIGLSGGSPGGGFATASAININNNVSFGAPIDPWRAMSASRDGVLSAARRIGL